MFANVVRVFLQGELDVEVEIFSSAESFLDSEINRFDLILLDYYLNISDFFAPSGEVVLNEMKSKDLKVPVILFSDLNDFLGGKGSQGSNCRYCPKSNGSNLLRVYLNHIDEEDTIIVCHTIP